MSAISDQVDQKTRLSQYGFFVAASLLSLYLYFLNFSIPLLNYKIALTEWASCAFIAISTILISPHIIRMKLVFWRVFLQTFLDTKSRSYMFFSHGYMVRILSCCVSFYLATHILILFCMAREHSVELLMFIIGVSLFYLYFFQRDSCHIIKKMPLRLEIAEVVSEYFRPFSAAIAVSFCVSLYVIFSILTGAVEAPEWRDMALVASTIVTDADMSSRLLRAAVRHVHLFDMSKKIVLDMGFVGNIVYVALSIFSERTLSIFSMILVFYPWRPLARNGD